MPSILDESLKQIKDIKMDAYSRGFLGSPKHPTILANIYGGFGVPNSIYRHNFMCDLGEYNRKYIR